MNTQDFNAVKKEILEITGQHVDLLHDIWLSTFKQSTCEVFIDQLRDHVLNFYTNKLNEERKGQQKILEEINCHRAEATDLTRLLHKTVDIYEGRKGAPLVKKCSELSTCIKLLRKELASRCAEICELLQEQKQLCEELDEMPLSLQEDPLPLLKEMDAFRDHLAQLRNQRVERLKKMDQLRCSIRADMNTLELFRLADSEEHLLSQENQTAKPEVLSQLRQMQKKYAQQVHELRKNIDAMRRKIKVLWTRLPETEECVKRRVQKSIAYYNKGTYDVLLEELQRCHAIRSKNLKTFIEKARSEIKMWWDLTLTGPQQREHFTSYFTDCESENILELEMELDGLKDFYRSNKELFELYAQRAELWERMEALVAKANDPNRFNNRGGQLLKEEKERNAISAKLPKIEQQITELARAFESRKNTPFLVYGEDIQKSMALDWEQLRHLKPVSAAFSKVIPPSEPVGLKLKRKTSSSSLRKTPVNPGIARSRTAGDFKNSSTVQLEHSFRRFT